MQAKELMHGDLMMYGGNVCMFVIDAQGAYIKRLSDGNMYLPSAASEAEPIPLTPEMLEKNGWTLLSNWNDEAYYSECGKFHLHFRYGKLRLIIHSRVIIVEYVHQLQHALRLCGLNEIADNFKV